MIEYDVDHGVDDDVATLDNWAKVEKLTMAVAIDDVTNEFVDLALNICFRSS